METVSIKKGNTLENFHTHDLSREKLERDDIFTEKKVFDQILKYARIVIHT
jgi:hypothetical protein